MGLTAIDAATTGGADRHRRGVLASRAVADAGEFGNDLVETRENIVGELDLGDRAHTVCGHAHRHGDDRALIDRRVEDAGRTVFLLQAARHPENAAEIADILAEGEHALILGEFHIHGAGQRLHHVHLGHMTTLELREPSW